MKSPCVKECKLEDGICVGCMRTLAEIASWSKLTMSEHMEIMNRIKGRTTTHECPSCSEGTYCAMEAGKSANLCWCMIVERDDKPEAGDMGNVCLCKKCLTGKRENNNVVRYYN